MGAAREPGICPFSGFGGKIKIQMRKKYIKHE
jgi:hypothetical protein